MNADFEIEDGELKAYNGSNEEIIIPDNIITIKEFAFYENKNVKKVIMPNTVKYIEPYAFSKCTNLKEVVLSNNIGVIQNCTFENCYNLEKINLDKIDVIEMCAFAECGFKNIELKNIHRIESEAFLNCKKLNEVKIENIFSLEDGIFDGCSVKKIYISNIEDINTFVNNSAIEELIINDSLPSSQINAIIGSGNYALKSVIGPNIICENGVVYNKDKSVLIAYLESNVEKKFKIPDSVKRIIHNAFFRCENLEELQFGKNVEFVEHFAIQIESLKTLKINEKIKSITENGISIFNNTNIFLYNNIIALNKHSIYNEDKQKITLNIYKINKNESDILKKFINYNSEIEIKNINFTLEDLIEEGKTFKEINSIIKEQER